MSNELAWKPSTEKAIVVGFLAATLALAIVVACLPTKTLTGIVADDAFYYLVIGRHIAQTGVSTFDGQNLANGYHPGWMMLITMVARWFSGAGELLRSAVFMGLALHAAAGWLLYLCLKRSMSGVGAALAAAFWTLSYTPLLTATFAMECGLYCFAFLLSYLIYLDRIEPYLRPAGKEQQQAIPTANLLLFGLAIGLCLWVRTEAVLLLACAIAWLGITSLRRRAFLKGLFEASRRGVLTGGAAAATIAPWLLYSLHTFGSMRQASGVMKMLWMKDDVARLDLGERLWQHGSGFVHWLAVSAPWSGGGFGVCLWTSLGWLGLIVFTAAYILRGPQDVRRAVGRAPFIVAYPLTHLLVAGIVYSTYFSEVHEWYYALPCLECYLVLAILGGMIYRAASAARARQTLGCRGLCSGSSFHCGGLPAIFADLAVWLLALPTGHLCVDWSHRSDVAAGGPGRLLQRRHPRLFRAASDRQSRRVGQQHRRFLLAGEAV